MLTIQWKMTASRSEIMDNFEIQSCLDSMVILVDTREHPSRQAEKRYKAFGAPYERVVLDYGDYAYNFTLPSGKRLYGAENSTRIHPKVVVERKMSLDELAMCFGRQRERFEREFDRAKSHGARIYLLIENSTWENLLNGKYRSKLHPKAFAASLTAWTARYDMIPIMCKAETSGKLIKEILYRELKERLEDGRITENGAQNTYTETQPESQSEWRDKDKSRSGQRIDESGARNEPKHS